MPRHPIAPSTCPSSSHRRRRNRRDSGASARPAIQADGRPALAAGGKGRHDQASPLEAGCGDGTRANAKAQNGLGIRSTCMATPSGVRAPPSRGADQSLSVDNHLCAGKFLLEQDHADQAPVAEFQTTVSIRQHYVPGEEGLGSAYQALGDDSAALAHWRRGAYHRPQQRERNDGPSVAVGHAPTHPCAMARRLLSLAENANRLASGRRSGRIRRTGTAWAENGQFTNRHRLGENALWTWRLRATTRRWPRRSEAGCSCMRRRSRFARRQAETALRTKWSRACRPCGGSRERSRSPC